jgi:hypothetical protein
LSASTGTVITNIENLGTLNSPGVTNVTFALTVDVSGNIIITATTTGTTTANGATIVNTRIDHTNAL